MEQQIDTTSTRKRMFELIEKLFMNKKNNLSFINYVLTNEVFNPKTIEITMDEFKELVEILINNNPYIQHEKVEIKYEKDIRVTGGSAKANMEYTNLDNTISIMNSYVSKAKKDPIKFMEFVSSIGHEQRHHDQHLNYEDDLTMDYYGDISRELMFGHFKDGDIKEIYNFIVEHNMQDERLSKLELLRRQFGAYLSNACEVDARQYELKFANDMFSRMINDGLCPEELRTKLIRCLKKYNEEEAKINERLEKEMGKYKALICRLKDVFKKLLKTDVEKLSQEKYIQLLTKCMTQISKEMTPEEKVEFMGWAMENKYLDLIENISFDAHGKDRDAVTKFISKSVEDKKITDENALTMFMVQTMQFNNPEDVKRASTVYLKKLIDNGCYLSARGLMDNFQNQCDVQILSEHIMAHAQAIFGKPKAQQVVDKSQLIQLLFALTMKENVSIDLKNKANELLNCVQEQMFNIQNGFGK